MKQEKKEVGTKKPHLSYEERVQIKGFLVVNYSYQEIADALKRSKAAIGNASLKSEPLTWGNFRRSSSSDR